jgi:polyphosphate kinase
MRCIVHSVGGEDERVLSIKQTLYRTSEHSLIVRR